MSLITETYLEGLDAYSKESAGDIIRKLFEEKEEEIDLDEVLEVKRIMGVKLESSPYAHIAQVYAIGSDQGEGNPSPTPRASLLHVSCKHLGPLGMFR